MAYVVFILCVLLNSLAFADEWELARHDNQRQIQVYVSSQNNSSYHQFELANGETRYWKNMSIENLRRLGFYLESEGE